MTISNSNSYAAKTTRCAIIGIGAMGKKYALMLDSGEISGLSLTAVCCRSDENAQWASSRLSNSVKIFRSEEEMYENSQCFDAVIIVTPHKKHPAMAIRAFEAGKHVLCDKPAGALFTDAEAMNEAAARSGKIYAMMCHQRTYAQHVKVRSLLTENAIGEIRRIFLESTGSFRTQFYHHSSDWRSSWTGEGGGVLINQGYHLMDLWQYLFGLPLSLYADIPFGKYNDFDVDDESTIVMDYPGKVTGTIIMSTGEGVPTERLEIIGTRGRILLDGTDVTLTRFHKDLRDYARSAQVTSTQELSMTEETYEFGSPDRAYQIMLQNFSDALTSGTALIAPGRDSADTLSMINGAYLSAWQGRKVTLPLDGAQYAEALKAKMEAETAGK